MILNRNSSAWLRKLLLYHKFGVPSHIQDGEDAGRNAGADNKSDGDEESNEGDGDEGPDEGESSLETEPMSFQMGRN